MDGINHFTFKHDNYICNISIEALQDINPENRTLSSAEQFLRSENLIRNIADIKINNNEFKVIDNQTVIEIKIIDIFTTNMDL